MEGESAARENETAIELAGASKTGIEGSEKDGESSENAQQIATSS